MKTYGFPTPDELYALEQAARRNRSEHVGKMFADAKAALGSAITRAAAVLKGGYRHA